MLNDQTSHFSDWLKKLTGKELNLNLLKEIPVSINPGIGITDYEEKMVFNTKEYWESLPLKQNAANRINEIQKRFGFKVLFFSYRDWPQYGNQEASYRQDILARGYTPLQKKEIPSITTTWLKNGGINAEVISGFFPSLWHSIKGIFISQKKVIIEMGNPYISDTRFWNYFRRSILNKNRFQGANIQGFRFFIEDTPENAIKLSSLCDYVFMFEEPYNMDIVRYNFPKNVIMVKSWNDIYRYLKSLT